MSNIVEDFTNYRIRSIEVAEAQYYETLIRTLDKIERDYKIKFEKDLKDSFTPIFEQKEHKKTTIKARKLVREMSLRAKWLKNFKD